MATSFDKETRLPEPPKSKEREMVILELPFREHDESSEHKKEFFEFLSSLGYEVEPHKDLNTFKLNGIEFNGDFSAAASIGVMGYSRKRVPRKVRKITVKNSWSSDDNCFTVTVNKPTDKLLLIGKINTAIAERKEHLDKLAARIAARENNALALANKYRVIDGFKSIHLKKGALELYTKSGCIYFDRTGKVTGISVSFPTVTRIADLHKLSIEALEVNEAMTIAKNQIKLLGDAGIEEGAEDTSAYISEGKIKL